MKTDRRVVWGLVLGRGDRSRFGSLTSQEAQQWTRRGQWPKAGQEEGNPRHVSSEGRRHGKPFRMCSGWVR